MYIFVKIVYYVYKINYLGKILFKGLKIFVLFFWFLEFYILF